MSGIEASTKLEKRFDDLEKRVAELEQDKRQQAAYIALEVAKAQRPQPRGRVQAIVRERREP